MYRYRRVAAGYYMTRIAIAKTKLRPGAVIGPGSLPGGVEVE